MNDRLTFVTLQCFANTLTPTLSQRERASEANAPDAVRGGYPLLPCSSGSSRTVTPFFSSSRLYSSRIEGSSFS